MNRIRCLGCGKTAKAGSRGEPKKFCGDFCRLRWHQQRRRLGIRLLEAAEKIGKR
jgi:hypothetical protein